MTNSEFLRATVATALAEWSTEGESARHNEGGWTAVAVDPILTALGWLKSRGNSQGYTARYEWPEDRGLDVALMHGQRLVSFIELKRTRSGAVGDLPKKLAAEPRASSVDRAMAWHFTGSRGLSMFSVTNGKLGPEIARIPIGLADEAIDSLAGLAAPVVLGRMSAEAWLSERTQKSVPTARICLRRLRRTFAKELSNLMGAEVGPPRRAPSSPSLPTMTYAYFALPETEGEVRGVGLNINPALDQMHCLFYRKRGRPSSGKSVSIAEEPTRAEMRTFVGREVLPRLQDVGRR